MKIFKNLFSLTVTIMALSAMIVVGYGMYLFYQNGRAFACRGDVKVYKATTGEWGSFDMKYTLKEGDAIRTGADSACELIFGPTAGTAVKVEERTEIKILAKDPAGLELVDGELLAALTRPSGGSKFTVKTPVGTCGVRGTGWRVSSHDASETEIEVFEGRVRFGSSDSRYKYDPYITPGGNRLKIKKSGTMQYEHETLEPKEYIEWNKWVNSSSKKLSGIGVANYIAESKPDPFPVWQEGICYASWQSEGYVSVESEVSFLKMEEETNASWVNIAATWYQKKLHSTEIYMHIDKTATDENLVHLFKKAQKLGLRVMLTPLLDIEEPRAGAWRAEIGFRSNEQWDAWFKSYEAFIMHYAELSSRHNVEILNIGTELTLASTQRPDKWIELIKQIREVYKGRLVYTANWFEEYKDVQFWGYLDYAGISAYFPVAQTAKPTYNEIKKGWQPWLEEIEAWQKTHGRPVIFPEIGYRSIEGCAKEPWNYMATGAVDLQQQLDCYRAAFETFWGKEWFYGMYWWVWRTKAYILGEGNRDYTPNDKPAGELVNEWYSKPDPHTYKNLMERAKDKFSRP